MGSYFLFPILMLTLVNFYLIKFLIFNISIN